MSVQWQKKQKDSKKMKVKNNMLNKPITLLIILILVYFVAICVLAPINSSLYSFLLILIILFVFSVYMGQSYVKTFKVEQPKHDRIKISAYFSIFWIVFCSIIVALLIMNTTLKNAPLFDINARQAFILAKMLLLALSEFSINGLFIYLGLNAGNKLGLRINDS